jgi:hypothetical protein
MTCCDHGYGRPSWRPRVFLRQAQDKLILRRTVQVRFGTNTLHAAQAPALRAVARWHDHLHGLATAIHEISGLGSAKWYRCQKISLKAPVGFAIVAAHFL